MKIKNVEDIFFYIATILLSHFVGSFFEGTWMFVVACIVFFSVTLYKRLSK